MAGFPTTTKHFDTFVKECNKWIRFFGLFDWNVEYFHGSNDDLEKSSKAYFYHNRVARGCAIYLSRDFHEKIITIDLKRSAFHEIVESLLLGDVRLMLYDRGYTSDEVDREIHKLVRTFENTVFVKCQ